MKRKKKKSNFILLLPAMAVFFLITAAYIASYRQSAQRNKPEPGPVIPQESGVEILSGSRREETTPNDTNGGETEASSRTRDDDIPATHGIQTADGKEKTDGIQAMEETQEGEILPAGENQNIYVTPRMSYTLQIYDALTDALTEQEEAIPYAMYGLNQRELSQYLTNLAEQENKDLIESEIHYDLVSFSSRNFTVRKTISQKEPEYAVFLIAEAGMLTAYTGDRTQIYEYTQIPLGDFPLEEQAMLTNGVFMKTLQDYYDFLETHSS